MKQRTIEALRALAERPGTEAEGQLAREILARFEGGAIADIPTNEETVLSVFRDFLRREASSDDLIAALRRQQQAEMTARRLQRSKSALVERRS